MPFLFAVVGDYLKAVFLEPFDDKLNFRRYKKHIFPSFVKKGFIFLRFGNIIVGEINTIGVVL